MAIRVNEPLLLGCHLSIAGGFTQAIDEAEKLGNTALQFFTHAPSAWRMKALADGVADRFRERRERSSIEMVVVHAMYLLNLASPDDALHARSATALIEEVRRADRLGADGLVVHLGAHVGSGLAAGIDRIVAAVNGLLASPVWIQSPGLRLLLENTAGAGTTVGAAFEELALVLAGAGDLSRIGICLDTCHAFAAGYDLRTAAAIERTLQELDQTIGLERVQLIHLNDSQLPLGSRRDRHEHIGRGEIGAAGLGMLVREARLRDLPFVLETPKKIDGRANADRVNLAMVRRLRMQEEAS